MQTTTHVRHHNTRVASKYLQDAFGITFAPSTLNRLRCVGGGPGFRRVGRSVLYPEAELDSWAAAKLGAVMTSTSDTGAGDALHDR